MYRRTKIELLDTEQYMDEVDAVVSPRQERRRNRAKMKVNSYGLKAKPKRK